MHAHLSHPQRIPQCIYKTALYIHKRALYIKSKGSTFVQARKSLMSSLTHVHARTQPCALSLARTHPCALSLAPTRAHTRVLSHSRPRVRAPVCSLTRAHTRAHPCALSLAPTHARTRVLFHSRPRVHTCAHPRVCATRTHSLTITHPTHTRTYAQHTRELFIYKSWLSISARYVSRHTSSSI